MAAKSPQEEFNVDTILNDIGCSGLFHIRMYLLLLVPVLLFSMYDTTYIFTTARLDYRCKVDECDTTGTRSVYETDWLRQAVPYSDDGKPEKCQRFVPNVDGIKCGEPGWFNRSQTVRCENFVYATTDVSLVNEFNLTCPENEWKLASIGSLGYIADILMLPLHGWVSDRYGRRMLIIVALLSVGTVGMAKTYASSFGMYVALKFVLSLFTTGSFTTLFIMVVEWVTREKRVLASMVTFIVYSVGQILLGMFASYFRHFRTFLRVLYVPALLMLATIWMVPESLRWMHNKGQHDRIRKTVERAARLNKVSLSVDSVQQIANSIELGEQQTRSKSHTKTGGRTIFASKILFVRLLICAFCMFTNSIIYTGLNVHSQSLVGSAHFNYVMVNMAEIPGVVIAFFVMDRFGRRLPLCISLIVTAGLCMTAELVHQFDTEYDAAIRLAMCVACKCSISLSYNIVFVYSSELFPTQLRQSFMNNCFALSCVGSMLAPQIRLLDLFMPSATMLLFAGIASVACGLVLYLPETLGRPLPDTIKQAEMRG